MALVLPRATPHVPLSASKPGHRASSSSRLGAVEHHLGPGRLRRRSPAASHTLIPLGLAVVLRTRRSYRLPALVFGLIEPQRPAAYRDIQNIAGPPRASGPGSARHRSRSLWSLLRARPSGLTVRRISTRWRAIGNAGAEFHGTLRKGAALLRRISCFPSGLRRPFRAGGQGRVQRPPTAYAGGQSDR